MTHIETMKLALDALILANGFILEYGDLDPAITALQAALAEPKAEPVAWHVSFNGGESWTVYEFDFKPDITDNNNGVLVRPLYYTHPPVPEPVAYLARHTSGDVQVATTIHGIYRDTALSIEPLYLHPPVPEPRIDFTILHQFADQQRISYNELCTAVHLAVDTQPSKPVPEPLSDEEIEVMYHEHSAYQEEGPETSGWYDFARAIEAAIRRKT